MTPHVLITLACFLIVCMDIRFSSSVNCCTDHLFAILTQTSEVMNAGTRFQTFGSKVWMDLTE